MNSKNINNFEIDSLAESRKVELVPLTPISYTINTYTVNINQGTESAGDVAYCDVDRSIHCNISITPGAKYKTIKRVLLLLRHRSGAEEGFAAHTAFSNTMVDSRPFTYVENRRNTSGVITHRVIDVTSLIKGAKTQTIHLAILHSNGDMGTVYTSGNSLEIEYLEDNDFIENVSKLENNIGKKGAYSVNTRNGKLFYTQSLIQAKGGRMPLSLSMTYNAADCDTNSPNGFSTGIKGWTFNYAQTLKTSTAKYTLLDGAHKYRTFSPAKNNSAIKHDVSGKSGLVLMEDSTGYSITDGKTMTYTFDTNKRLVNVTSAGGTSSMTTSVAYNDDGKIDTIIDGMSDVYSFVYGTNTITISKSNTEIVELALTDERITQVKYLLSGETYSFTYNTNSELQTVIDTSSNEKTIFTYSDAGAVTAIKNYIYNDSTESPTGTYFLNYTVLKTLVSKCRNSDLESRKYSTTVYVFRENGETISAYEDGPSGAFTHMRIRTKDDYERYVANIEDVDNAEEDVNIGTFSFDSQAFYDCATATLGAITTKYSDTLEFDTTNSKSENVIFSAKACVEYNSFTTDKTDQRVSLHLIEGSNTLCTLEFDPQSRDYQLKGSMIKLSHGKYNLKALVEVNDMRAAVRIFDVAICETGETKRTEYITGFVDNTESIEVDSNNTVWYSNKGNFKLTSGSITLENISFTFKDYLLTTINRLKNPSAFNVWYNDGKNMLANVSTATLTKNSVSQNITNVRCSTVVRGMGKAVISTVKASNISGCLIDAITNTRVEKPDGTNEFFTSSTSYDSFMKIVKMTNEDDIVTQYTYNEYGEVLTEKIFPTNNGVMNTLVSRTYQDGNLSSVSEYRNNLQYTKMFEYNADDTLAHEITANGQYIYHSYTDDGEKLTRLSADVSGINANDMTYDGDLINSFNHNSTDITFAYDEKNNVESVNIGGTNILSKEITYNSYGTTQSVSIYGNGTKIKKYYDKYNRLIKVTELEVDTETRAEVENDICAYIYSDAEVADSVVLPTDASLKITSSSKLRAFVDNAAGERTKYLYDEFGNLKEKQTGDVREYINERDKYNRVTSTVFTDGTKTVQNDFLYENNNTGRVQSEQILIDSISTDVNYARDALKRLTTIKIAQGGNGYKRLFAYIPRGTVASPEGTTNYIESISYYNVINDAEALEKTESIAYNADGNIITCGENTYVYDRIGRLVRENNKPLDKTYTFVYNEGGNIISKNEYAYTEGELITPTKTYNYTYGNAWKDQLTSFDGNSITYDTIGNPISYLGATLIWSRGRLLTTCTKVNESVHMTYGANGIRRTKTVQNTGVFGIELTSTRYTYDSEGRLRTETKGAVTRRYLYSSDGIVGYEENGERLMYRKNLFGDITAIYQSSTKVAEYVYDAWGNCTITYDPDGYGASNPIRYRGYYWDSDLGMYYLMTRYYDPKIGRFINADSLEYLDPKSINGLNLYAYCRNNPIMHIDPMGTQFCQTSFDGEYDLDDDMYNNGLGGGGGGYYGYGSAYYTYTVRTNTATHDAQLGGYHSSGTTSAMTNPSYFIVPGAITVTDGMATQADYLYNFNGSKDFNYVYNRGWNHAKITNAINNGKQGTSINIANDALCTAYRYPNADNQYVVIENGRRCIVQVSNLYDLGWIPDKRINWGE